jgi:tetratricopeptide (TPR) repeat protein
MMKRHHLPTARALTMALALTWVARIDAQSRRPTQAGRAASTAQREVRAELAATLLNAKRYSEAAAEYRRLLTADPNNHDYRLALGRALAWGDRPREAERELLLARDRRNAATIEPLLRSVRDAFDPTATEAAAWLRESPGYLPYRLAFARALAREDPRRSIAQFDTLRFAAIAGNPQVPRELTLIREQADAYVAMGTRASAVTLLGVALAAAPADTSIRHALASTLFDAGLLAAARAQYDTLVRTAPTANAYLGRATAALALFDSTAALQDVARSIELAPSYDAYYLRASLAREHEDFVNARRFYDAAERMAPDAATRRDVAAAGSELARRQRPVIAFEPDMGTGPGWTMRTQSAADNARVLYVAMDASRAAPLPGDFVGNVDFGVRRIAQAGAVGIPGATGTAASVGIARRFSIWRMVFGGAADGGFVAHPGVTTFGRGSASLGAWFDAWAAGANVSREPAYEALFTPAALSTGAGEASALIAKTATFSAAGPLGPVDVAGGWTRTWLSDGNSAESFNGNARAPLTGGTTHLFAVYEADVTSYASPSRLYWDPVHFTSNAIGPEIAVRHGRGLSMSVRGLAGYASAVLRDTTDNRRLLRQSALQLTAGGDVSYRATWWETAADVAYGRARAGGYQRVSAAVTVRLLR